MSITPRRIVGLTLVAAAATLALAACQPEPGPGAPTVTPTPTFSIPEPTHSLEPVPTDKPQAAEITLPADCTAIYSPAMLAQLNAENPPLNDPGVTLLSTEVIAGLEIMDTAPTIRCSWGQPSEFGLATNVTIVTEAQSADLLAALQNQGMSCADEGAATVCRIETEHMMDGEPYATVGETHYLRGNGWIATHWINFGPEGYTNDIAQTLWG